MYSKCTIDKGMYSKCTTIFAEQLLAQRSIASTGCISFFVSTSKEDETIGMFKG